MGVSFATALPERRWPTVSMRGGVAPPLTLSRIAGALSLALQPFVGMSTIICSLVYGVYKRAYSKGIFYARPWCTVSRVMNPLFYERYRFPFYDYT
jgi:hypothetical protein